MSKKITNEEFLDRLKEVNPSIQPLEQYIRSHDPLKVQCKKCGHEWTATPHNLLRGSGCIVCAKKKKRTNEEFLQDLEIVNPNILPLESYTNLSEKITVECKVCGNKWSASPHNLLRGSGCPNCAHLKLGNKSRKDYQLFLSEMANINPDITVLGNYINSSSPILVKCNNCEHEWLVTPNNLLKGSGCPKCNHFLKTSFPEQAIFYYVKRDYPDAINSFTDIFKDRKTEIDIYIPSKKIGIEYDGAFWHNDDSSYKREKTKYNICKSHGIRLIRIKENAEHSGYEVSDITIHTKEKLDDTIKELSKYIALSSDIDVSRDTNEIKEQYYGSTAIANAEKEFLDILKAINPNILVLGKYISNSTPIKVKCLECDYIWVTTPNNLLHRHGCPQCAIAIRSQKQTKKHDTFINELQKVDPSIEVLQEYVNTKTKIAVRCKKCGYRWETTPNNLLRGHGCMKCSGYTNIKKTTSQFLKELKQKNPNISIIGEYTSANGSITAKCNRCGYTWDTTPSKLLNGQKCPSENGLLPKTTDSFKKELEVINPSIEILSEYESSKKPILAKCRICGFEWYTTPNNLLSAHGCPECFGNKKRTQSSFIKELYSINPNIRVIGVYENANTPIKVKCLKCGYEWETRPTHLLRGHGCPIEGRSIRKTQESFVSELKLINPNILVLGGYINSKTKIKVKCLNCGNEWDVVPQSLLQGHGCPHCSKETRRKKVSK